ncbi:MAG: glycerol-3-phosphate 1-O-acyltransferase PlsY [Opitutaceae bacterium]|nr:glycerol-3-phosphate 1-O-acyltransferase PlsY [Opitutaceae bacterium]
MILPILIALLAGYMLGSLPFGVWVARAHGVDIFNVGSGNPGATNVKRSVGKKAGNLVFLLDFLKGALATIWPLALAWFDGPGCACDAEQIERMAVAGMVGAIVGHSYSCLIGFRGGKGVATSIGGLLALCWPVALLGVAVWVVVFYTTRYVSLASILLAASLPVSALLLHRTQFLILFFGLLGVFIILRHRENIARLFAGKESKFVKKKAEVPKTD